MKKDVKRQAVRRLKILEGQIRGLQKMVREERYCVDILCQSAAAKEALSAVEDIILKNHLSTHVIDQIKNNKKERAIKEILQIYKLSKKK